MTLPVPRPGAGKKNGVEHSLEQIHSAEIKDPMAARSHQNRKPRDEMGEALQCGHEMLNHPGRVIRMTRRTIRTLDMRNYPRRGRRSGLLQLRLRAVEAERAALDDLFDCHTMDDGGGTIEGSGKVIFTPAGSGRTFTIDAKAANGGTISGTMKCSTFSAWLKEGRQRYGQTAPIQRGLAFQYPITCPGSLRGIPTATTASVDKIFLLGIGYHHIVV